VLNECLHCKKYPYICGYFCRVFHILTDRIVKPGPTLQRGPAALRYRARQLYKNISMLFLFPVKDGKLSTGVNATFDASCYG